MLKLFKSLKRQSTGEDNAMKSSALLFILLIVPLTTSIQSPPKLVISIAVRGDFLKNKEIEQFLTVFIKRSNMRLFIEDERCILGLAKAIPMMANVLQRPWIEIAAISWIESTFDCHAKNYWDTSYGHSYGAWQVNEVWNKTISCDIRVGYWKIDAHSLCVLEVMKLALRYKKYKSLVRRGFRFPLACMWNGQIPKRGYSKTTHKTWRYCVDIGRRAKILETSFTKYHRQVYL